MKRYFQDKAFGQASWVTTNEKVTHTFPFDIDIPIDERDRYVKLREYESLFSVAHEYLGDEHLWWVLIIANKSKGWRLPWDAAAHDIIRIPTLTKPYLESLKAYFASKGN